MELIYWTVGGGGGWVTGMDVEYRYFRQLQAGYEIHFINVHDILV